MSVPSGYWSSFEDLVRLPGHDLAMPTSPAARDKGYIQWSGLPLGFNLVAYGPRVRLATGTSEMSVELIHRTGISQQHTDHILRVLPKVRLAWGDDLDHRPSDAKEFKIDASAPAEDDPADWPRQHRWLLSGIARLDLMFRPILEATPR